MDINLWSSIIIGASGISATIYFSYRNYKLSYEVMQKQLFSEFNGRYDKLNNFLIEIEEKFQSLEELNKSSRSTFLKQKVVDYFCLCAEEYYWHKHKRRIDKIIWDSWQAGMNYWYNQVPVIKELWLSELAANGRASYYIKVGEPGFFVDESKGNSI